MVQISHFNCFSVISREANYVTQLFDKGYHLEENTDNIKYVLNTVWLQTSNFFFCRGKPIKDHFNPEKYDYLVNFCNGFTCSYYLSDGGSKDAVVSGCFVVVGFMVGFCVCAQHQFMCD